MRFARFWLSNGAVVEWDFVARWILRILLLDLTATVSVMEVLWTLPALVLVIRYSQRAAASLREQRRYRHENQPLTLRIRTQIRSERFLSLTVIAELLLGLGVLAMLQPPSEAAERWEPIAVVSAGFLFAIVGVLLLKGEMVERHERALGWLYEQQVRLHTHSAEAEDDVHGHMAGLMHD